MARRWQAFPEENPNLVIECDAEGGVRYANPEARSRFPDLEGLGWRHPLLVGVHELVGGIDQHRDEYVSREVDLDEGVFEQKICFSLTAGSTVFRIYAHDVTALRRTEEAMEALATRLVVAQEEERHRVSRELHDEAGQALVALKISMQLIRDDAAAVADELVPSLEQAVDLVEATRDQLRVIAHDLRPPALDTVGLNGALEGFCADFAGRAGLEINYSGTEGVVLGDAPEISLYRFLQEALTNIAAHAQASDVQVTLEEASGEVRLTVTDDGVGFELELLDEHTATGMGIAGMRERIELLGGTVTIESALTSGTSVTARLPVT